MSELIVLKVENGELFRCASLDQARAMATSMSASDGRIFVEITPAGVGGPMTTLEFDRKSRDWISMSSVIF